MKFASFEVDTPTGPVRRVGVATEGNIVDLTAAYAAHLESEGKDDPVAVARTVTPPEMLAFLSRGDQAMEAAEDAVKFAAKEAVERAPDGANLRYELAAVNLLSPLPRPNSLRDCMVFEEHVENTIGEDIPDVWYEHPIYYKGNPDSVVAPSADVEWPSYTEKLDYELELAAVVGKRGRDIPAEQADDYIAGFTVFNDFSARDIQKREMQAMLGPAKGKDFANALGPYLVTPDEFDVGDAEMTAAVNGEVWSEGSLGEMHHDFTDIVVYVSKAETLHPGDVLGSGTVGRGCGLELDRWLEPGDTVSLTIDGIGTLENRVM